MSEHAPQWLDLVCAQSMGMISLYYLVRFNVTAGSETKEILEKKIQVWSRQEQTSRSRQAGRQAGK